MAASSVVSSVPQHQVFLNFRGKLRNHFVCHLEKALGQHGINFFIDAKAAKGQNLNIFFKEIQKSRIALAIISEGYTESEWCLNELVTIKERTDEGKLVTIPIFYKVEPKTVKHLKGAFGDALRKRKQIVGGDRMNKWEEAFKSVCDLIGFTFDGNSSEYEFIDKIVKEVLKELSKISSDASSERSLDPSQNTEVPFGEAKAEIYGLKQRLKELKHKVNIKKDNETRIIGVVGMHGIGKTTLVKTFYKTWKHMFLSGVLLQNISGIVKFDASGSNCNLPGMLLKKLLKNHNIDEEDRHENYVKDLRENKVFIVLDGVNSKKQIEVLLKGHHDWTKNGSKIVIATSDKSLLEGWVQDIYEVPQLNHRDGLRHFYHYAFDHSANKEGFMKLSEEFVHYVRGHPLTLEVLGKELRGKSVEQWQDKLKSFAQKLGGSIRDLVFQVSYDELSQEQKDTFLDIACFRSHDLDYVESLLDSSSSKAKTIIKALMDKFLINTSDSSGVEMHDLLYTFATEIGSKANGKGRHQCNINYEMKNTNGDNGNVRVKGIFLDLSQMMEKKIWTINKEHFKTKLDLRYLKFYSTHCPRECNPRLQIYIPEKLDFPLEEVRCLHWLKYPLEELPTDFNPKNLVDLKLPYSKIKQIWKDKDAPKLKWVDLNHSIKLNSLSGLSKAQKLQTLNLEGCTALKTLDPDMQNMESLVFLNLKGCTALDSFPDIKLASLKTIVLSNCSNLKIFLFSSEILEVLYLDGTAITELPTTMVKLVKLNMQDCKMLKKLPEEFDKLKVLQELVCSGCSTLSSLPDVMENMKCLQILLLDGTEISKIPHISSLERLCLSRNNHISLSDDMSQLSQLKWLDLKYCKNLSSIPELPPNLQCLDAHGCDSLKTVANPVATHSPMEQIHSTFIFTNCNKLGRTAKEEITTYAQRKCQMLSDALKRCNEGFVPEALFSTCFPGCEVPSWFCHEAVGSVLKPKLPAHWNENKFVGIALCAVVSFPNCQEPINSFSVTCKFDLKSKDGATSFDRLVGHWNELDKMASDHVFICYTRCSNNIKCLKDQHSGTCIPITASLEFGVTDEKAKLEVLKCGLRLVYASDEPQKTISDVTTKKHNNEAEFYKTSQTDEKIELQGLTPIRNGSFNSKGSGSVSPSGEDSSASYAEGR